MGVWSVSNVWLQQFHSSSSVKTSSNAAVKAQKRSSTWNKTTVLHVTNTLTVLHMCTVTQLHPTASTHTASSLGKHNKLLEHTSIRGRLAPLFKARNPRCYPLSLLILFCSASWCVHQVLQFVSLEQVAHESKLNVAVYESVFQPFIFFLLQADVWFTCRRRVWEPGNVKFKEL